MQLPVLVFIRSVLGFHSLLLKAQVILFYASIGFYSSVQPLFYHNILLVLFVSFCQLSLFQIRVEIADLLLIMEKNNSKA